MPLHLVEGMDMWDEVGSVDLILLCGNYAFGKKDLGLSVGYGAESLKKFPNLNKDLFDHFKFKRKPIKGLATSIWGLMIPDVSVYEGTRIGIWQIKEGINHDVNMDIVKYSIAMISNIAKNYRSVAIEYPCPEVHKGNEDLLYPVLQRVPDNCKFYRPESPLEVMRREAAFNTTNYSREPSNQNYHRR